MSGVNPGPVPPVAQNSSQPGYLQPSSSAPYYVEDDSLDNFFQQLVVGITGLPATMVRPLWQPEPANLPAYGTDWSAVGLIESELVPGWSYETHSSSGTGTDSLETWENCTFLASFYGPNAERYDGFLRDGLFIGQNQEILLLNGVGLVEWRKRYVVPELIKERWWRRVDRHVRVLREIKRTYNIENILSAVVSLNVEKPTGAPPNMTRTLSVDSPDTN